MLSFSARCVRSRRLRLAGLAALTLVFGLGTAERPDPAREGTFRAQWSVEGTQEQLTFGAERSFSIFRHTGAVTVVGESGLVQGALSKCIGLGDSAEGNVARCVWVDGSGDEIYSELRSDPRERGTGGAHGRFVGGSGRFAGLEGDYEFQWVTVPSLEREAIAGQTLSMTGRWKLP